MDGGKWVHVVDQGALGIKARFLCQTKTAAHGEGVVVLDIEVLLGFDKRLQARPVARLQTQAGAGTGAGGGRLARHAQCAVEVGDAGVAHRAGVAHLAVGKAIAWVAGAVAVAQARLRAHRGVELVLVGDAGVAAFAAGGVGGQVVTRKIPLGAQAVVGVQGVFRVGGQLGPASTG